MKIVLLLNTERLRSRGRDWSYLNVPTEDNIIDAMRNFDL